MVGPEGPEGPEVAEALARLDAQVAAGAIELVEYWRLRAEVESGPGGGVTREGSPAPGGVTLEESPAVRGGAVELLPPAPSLPPPAGQGSAVPAPVPVRPMPVGTPDVSGGGGQGPPPADVPAQDVPFAPPSGAVNLRYRVEPSAPRRRWWRRNRSR